MYRSEFEANTCNRRQAREKVCERGTIGFGFASHWLRKWRGFINQSEIESNACNQQLTAPNAGTCLRPVTNSRIVLFASLSQEK